MARLLRLLFCRVSRVTQLAFGFPLRREPVLPCDDRGGGADGGD